MSPISGRSCTTLVSSTACSPSINSSTPSTQLSRLKAAVEKISLRLWIGEFTSGTKFTDTANGSGSTVVSSVAERASAPRPSPLGRGPRPMT